MQILLELDLFCKRGVWLFWCLICMSASPSYALTGTSRGERLWDNNNGMLPVNCVVIILIIEFSFGKPSVVQAETMILRLVCNGAYWGSFALVLTWSGDTQGWALYTILSRPASSICIGKKQGKAFSPPISTPNSAATSLTYGIKVAY